jgi:uncharacterized protein
MEIRLSDIPVNGLNVEGEIPIEEMDLHEISFSIDSPFVYRFFLEIVDDVFIAKGFYKGAVNFICDRCLKAFTGDSCNENYIFAKEISAIEGETIDLTDGVREDILLALPIKVLCSEDCKGICPRCGADMNVEKCVCKQTRPETTPFSELDKLF